METTRYKAIYITEMDSIHVPDHSFKDLPRPRGQDITTSLHYDATYFYVVGKLIAQT
jgi:hypothetical protein